MYSQQIPAICLTLSNYIYFDTEQFNLFLDLINSEFASIFKTQTMEKKNHSFYFVLKYYAICLLFSLLRQNWLLYLSAALPVLEKGFISFKKIYILFFCSKGDVVFNKSILQ